MNRIGYRKLPSSWKKTSANHAVISPLLHHADSGGSKTSGQAACRRLSEIPLSAGGPSTSETGILVGFSSGFSWANPLADSSEYHFLLFPVPPSPLLIYRAAFNPGLPRQTNHDRVIFCPVVSLSEIFSENFFQDQRGIFGNQKLHQPPPENSRVKGQSNLNSRPHGPQQTITRSCGLGSRNGACPARFVAVENGGVENRMYGRLFSRSLSIVFGTPMTFHPELCKNGGAIFQAAVARQWAIWTVKIPSVL